MSQVPQSPRVLRQRRLAQASSTPTRGRSRNDSGKIDPMMMSSGSGSKQRSLLLPRMSNPPPSPRPVTPSREMNVNIIDRIPSTPPCRSYSGPRSVVSESAAFRVNDDALPDDEKQDSLQRANNGSRLRDIHQPFLSPSFDERDRARGRTRRSEVRRLNSILNEAHGHDGSDSHKDRSHRQPDAMPAHNVDAADQGGGAAIQRQFSHDDDVSSLGGVEDLSGSRGSISRLVQAFKAQSPAPALTSEEKVLWDVVQFRIQRNKREYQTKMNKLKYDYFELQSNFDAAESRNVALEKQLQKKVDTIETMDEELDAALELKNKNGNKPHTDEASSNPNTTALENANTELESKNQKLVSQMKDLQREHDRAIRAIQRVLADVSSQRDSSLEKLKTEVSSLNDERKDLLEQIQYLSSKNDASASDRDVAALRSRAQRAFALEREMLDLKSTVAEVEAERDCLTHDVERKGGKIVILEQELNVAKDSLRDSAERENSIGKRLDEASTKVSELKNEMESIKNNQTSLGIAPLSSERSTSQEVNVLKGVLREKQASLETAKNIITSLENANGSLSADLRGKLKAKEQEVSSLKEEVNKGKQTLDRLATELRDLKLHEQDVSSMGEKAKLAVHKQRALKEEIEQSLSNLRTAAAVHEAEAGDGSLDDPVVEQISNVLGDLLESLENAVSTTQHLESLTCFPNTEYHSTAVTGNNDGDSHLRRQLDEQRSTVRSLEEALRTQKLEMEKLRNQTEYLKLGHEEEQAKLSSEIRMLHDRCRTNMEVLTKKERELEVLRDSLEVGDGVGYISDDGSDVDDEEGNGLSIINRTTSVDSSVYSHSQAEAVATLLVQSGTGIEVAAGLSSERLEKLQRELKKANFDKDRNAKELLREKEALSNAKMIISSLERANKTMLEDLRSRLHDSNTAITSLLEKSSEQEKISCSLRSEMAQLKEEKEKSSSEWSADLSKLEGEKLAAESSLAAKDREIQELRQRLSQSRGDASGVGGIREQEKKLGDSTKRVEYHEA